MPARTERPQRTRLAAVARHVGGSGLAARGALAPSNLECTGLTQNLGQL
jgi:hypothetical protein